MLVEDFHGRSQLYLRDSFKFQKPSPRKLFSQQKFIQQNSSSYYYLHLSKRFFIYLEAQAKIN